MTRQVRSVSHATGHMDQLSRKSVRGLEDDDLERLDSPSTLTHVLVYLYDHLAS
jgi:hypothetical protein